MNLSVKTNRREYLQLKNLNTNKTYNKMVFPEYLYRFFEKECQRNDFFEGKMRFGSLEEYRKIEDEHRQDEHEGRPCGKYKTNKQMFLNISNKTGKIIESGYKTGINYISGSSCNKYFVLCFSSEKGDLKYLSNRLGKYIVKINNPKKLLDLINTNCKLKWNTGKITLHEVVYDRNDYIKKANADQGLPYQSYFAQKSKTFSEEYEWRMVIIGSAIKKINVENPIVEVGALDKIASKINI